MSVYLLDTSVFSQPLRRKPVLSALQHWRDAGEAHCRVSNVTLAEIENGIALEQSDLRWRKYEALLQNRLETVPSGGDVWKKFSSIKARQQKLGRMVADLDLLIAATAILHDWTVATLNHRDFSKIETLRWKDWGSCG